MINLTEQYTPGRGGLQVTESDGQNGQDKQAICLTVARDGSGDYDTVGEALAALGEAEGPPACIFIKKGVYRERLEIRRPRLTLEGESADSTVITYGLSAGMLMEDGSRRGTFRTYSVLVDTHDFTARNLTFENSAGPGEEAGQALALYVDGDRILFEGCRMLGGQDTLFTGPLPPKEIQKNGFIGPKQFSPRINGRHCYRNCFICGDIDFIFGSATAYFEKCELYSVGRDAERKGYVTAASTPRGQRYGYVFRSCRFTGNSAGESVYLGRPWRDYARTVLIDCYLGPHICREGWHDWDKKEARSTLFYGEYASYGPGAADRGAADRDITDRQPPQHGSPRPDWVAVLTCEQAQDYTMEKVLGGADRWNPGEQAYI